MSTTALVAASVPVAWELGVREREPEAGRARFEVLAVGEVFKPISAIAEVRPATWDGPGLVMGWAMFVER